MTWCLLFWWFTCSIHSILPLLHGLWFTCSCRNTRQRMQQVAKKDISRSFGVTRCNNSGQVCHATSFFMGTTYIRFLRLMHGMPRWEPCKVQQLWFFQNGFRPESTCCLGHRQGATNKPPETDRLEKHWGLHVYASSKLEFERTRTVSKFGHYMTLLDIAWLEPTDVCKSKLVQTVCFLAL